MSGKIAGTLQPAKFILLVLNIIQISVLMKTKNDHIYQGIAATIDTKSQAYTDASSVFMFWAWVTIICLSAEFLIIFSG